MRAAGGLESNGTVIDATRQTYGYVFLKALTVVTIDKRGGAISTLLNVLRADDRSIDR